MNEPAPAPPPRVRVTSSRRQAAHSRRVPISADVAAQTDLGHVYLSGLLRAQFRLSLVTLGVLGGVLAAFPVVVELFPAVGRAAVWGVPLPWILLGIAPYPTFWWVSRRYARQADRIEEQFTDVVGGP